MFSGKTFIMGILNITPDSFSDGGLYFDINSAMSRVSEMVGEGVDIIDIGGESTRPGSESVSVEEQINRVIPVIKEIRKNISSDILISVDTNQSIVAQEAMASGANIINAMGGFDFDSKLIEVVKKYNCSIVVYHINGTPKTMQESGFVPGDIVAEVKDFFKKQIELCESFGIDKKLIILDPGIGFGKSLEQNIDLIKRLKEFSELCCQILCGVSRKSHLGLILKNELNLKEIPGPMERKEAALAESVIAVENGASILRTHDVLETKRFFSVFDYIKNK